jgi:xylulokinase
VSDLYLGIDLGTTGIKVGVFGEDGKLRADGYREVELDAPAPGLTEFDAEAYVELAFEAVGDALMLMGTSRLKIRAIGFSSQAQSFALLGEDGAPVRPAVSWLDVRAAAEAEELSGLAGRPISTIASCPKVLWLKRNEPDSLERARRLLLVPDLVVHRLAGVAASDPVTAASTGAYMPWEGRWDGAVLAECGLSPEMTPEVRPAGAAVGRVTAEAAERLGLSEETLVVLGTNDQTAGAIGAGNVAAGLASISLGTALAVVVSSESREGLPAGVGVGPHPAAAEGRPLYALLAFAKTAGVVLRWFREGFTPSVDYERLLDRAAAVPVGANGLTCLPHFSGTATPDFNAEARGAFVGLSLAHRVEHMARALVESLCFTVRENLELISAAARPAALRAIGGGARSDSWLQMIADACGLRVERPRTREAACLGAAILAMAGSGGCPTVAEAAARISWIEKSFEPDAALRAAYDAAYARYRELRAKLYE